MSPETSSLVLPAEKHLITDLRQIDMHRRGFFRKTGEIAAAVAITLASDGIGVGAAENLANLRRKAWEAQNPMYDEISTVGMQRYYNTRKDRKKAFFTPAEIEAGGGRVWDCSDEGNRRYRKPDNTNDMLQYRTPGSGILLALSRDDKDPFAPEFIDATAKEALKMGVTIFTGHRGCGAAKAVFEARILWLKENGQTEEAEKLEKEGVDAFAKRWAEAVVARMKELAPERRDTIRSDFIEKLDRPQELHVARGIDITEIDALNAAYEGFPQMFVERTGDVDDEKNLTTVMTHADVLRQIAFDEEHSFGKEFSHKRSERFFMISIGRNRRTMEKLMAHADKKRMEMPLRDRERVAIDGFVPEPGALIGHRIERQKRLQQKLWLPHEAAQEVSV